MIISTKDSLVNDGLQVSLNMRPDLFRFCALEVFADSHRPVKFQDRLGLSRENFQSVQHRLGFIVLSLDQVLTRDIVFARYFGRLERKVINPA